MRLEGRIALGLDEFMLRLGHLKILLGLLERTSGNRARIARRLSDVLTKPVEVHPPHFKSLGEYLLRKKLSAVVDQSGEEIKPHPRARYSHLRLSLDAGGDVVGITSLRGEPVVTVWFQDIALSDPRTRSKVGAVTADTREISNKSGISHLVDWASILEIANKRLGLTAVGRALATVCGQAERRGTGADNPYVVDGERLALSRILFAADGDVLARLVDRLSPLSHVTKADAIELIVEVSRQLDKEVKGASVSAVRAVRDFQRDLGLHTVSRRAGRPPSTVWHRVSSRLESLTDLGFLEKADSLGERREYDYYYRPTELLKRASASLSDANVPSEWADKHLAEILASELPGVADTDDVGPELMEATRLCLGPTGIHIDSFAMVAASLALMNRKELSIAAARESLTRLAVEHPDLARLSRGYSGPRAEFASVVLAKLEQVGASAFSS